MSKLYPHSPDLDQLVPQVLVFPESGREVDGEYEEVFADLGRPIRQLLGILWLAHKGRLVDHDDNIRFDLTDPEAAEYLNKVTAQDVTRGNVTEVREPWTGEPHKPSLIRFNRIRECRQTGDLLHTFRPRPNILVPVEEYR